MDARPVERQLAALLSADVEGSSRLMGDDEAATVRTLNEYRGVIASAVAALGLIAGAAVVMVLGAGGGVVWRWLTTPEPAGLPLPDRPSVAVLPFANLSQDPAQEYFSDGVTEDLITGLSKVSGLFYPFYYLWTLGHAYYLTERRQEALAAFGKLLDENPNFLPAHAYRAVLFTELGRMKEAREAWERTTVLIPGASPPDLRERLPYKRPADLERLLAARRAGKP